MALEIKIIDDKILDLSNDAKLKLIEQVEIYINELISEARLVEADLREKDADKEITSSHIVQAARRGKNNFKKKKPWYVKLSKFSSPISILFVGLLFDNNGWTNQQWKLYVFCVVLCIAIATTILQYIKDGD